MTKRARWVAAGGLERTCVGVVMLLVAGLSACGGGSGGSSDATAMAAGGRSAPVYSIQGTVHGLDEGYVEVSNGLDVQRIDADADGSGGDFNFLLNTPLPQGAQYDLRILNDPLSQFGLQCEIVAGRGTMPAGQISNIQIRCARTKSLMLLAGQLSSLSHDGLGEHVAVTARALVWTPSGTVYLADAQAHTVIAIDGSSRVDVLAGTNNESGYLDAPDGTTHAKFNGPSGIAFDSTRNVLYVSDTNNHVIRQITLDGKVTRLAGQPQLAGNVGGNKDDARFSAPEGLVYDKASDSLVVADTGNNAVRRIDLVGGGVTTLSAGLSSPHTVALWREPSGAQDVLVAEPLRIYRLVRSGADKVLVASGSVLSVDRDVGRTVTYRDGQADCDVQTPYPASQGCARFQSIAGMAVGSDGAIYFSDDKSHNIRVIVGNEMSTFTGNTEADGHTLKNDMGWDYLSFWPGYADGPVGQARFNVPTAMAFDDQGRLFIADSGNQILRSVSNGIVSTYTGQPSVAGFVDGIGSQAKFNDPQGLAIHPETGDVYVADRGNFAIRRIGRDRGVHLVAGQPGQQGHTDGPANQATFEGPKRLAFDPSSKTLYVLDYRSGLVVGQIPDTDHYYLRAISENGDVSTRWTFDVARNGIPNSLTDMVVGANGDVWVLDEYAVHHISAQGEERQALPSEVSNVGQEELAGAAYLVSLYEVFALTPRGELLLYMRTDQPLQALAQDSSDTLYATMPGKSIIASLRPDRAPLTVAGSDGSDFVRLGPMPQPIGLPKCLAMTPKRLYFTGGDAVFSIDR